MDWHQVEHVLRPLFKKKDIAAFSKMYWKAIRREMSWLQIIEGVYTVEYGSVYLPHFSEGVYIILYATCLM